jgi:beta-lactamase class A
MSDALREYLRKRVDAVPGARVGLAWRQLGREGSLLLLQGDESFHAASTMKVPVMVEVLRRVDEGGLSLEESLRVENHFASLVDGSPYALTAEDDSDPSLYARAGEPVPVRELVERMIVRSSNLATNLLLERVGAQAVTESMRQLGLTRTQVLRGVEDGKAYRQGLNNTTTARDLATLLEAIHRGEAASPASCALMIEVLLRQEHNTEIPAGLPPGTPVAHKTGQISGTLHDAAIVDPAGPSPYVLVVLTAGIVDAQVARALIVDLAREVHAYTKAS